MSYDTLDLDFEAGVETSRSFLLCSTPRCGSYLLCELLYNTGLGGAPEEFFHPTHMPRLMRRWGARTPDQYRAALLAHKTGPNGVFGAKVHWGQYRPNFGEIDPRGLFPALCLVHIGRRDRLRQAISWVRAMQTLRWKAGTGPRKARPVEKFDADDITRKLKRLGSDEAAWEALFERHGIAPYRVVYEDMVAAPGETVLGVLAFLGISVPEQLEVCRPTLQRQSDELSNRWVERYLNEVTGA